MAKLSVYKTIDRSQLGGKFVPLIKSGVSNYKILASDLGKEYHPGDAIEITDTGEINVKFRPDDFDVSSGSLTIKTDESRGVFKGSNGIYIASANDSIGISRDGIKVNPEVFAGSGLSYHKHRLSVNAKAPLSADDNGLSLLIGGAGLEIVSGCLYLDSSVVSHTAADAVYYYMSTRTGSSLSIDQDYLVVNTNYIASAGLTTGLGNYNPISVDVKYVANAIGNNYIGSGLYWDNNNYTLSANVNTATGIIVQDNRLYLNAGAGLHTTNNTVKVKAADNTINVSSSGIKVNTSALYIPSAYSLAGFGLDVHYDGSLVVKSADGSIFVNGSGIGVDLRYAEYVGAGLTNSIGELAVKAADGTIDVSRDGIKVNAGYGLSATSDGLYVKSADNTIDVSSAGIKVNKSALSIPSASSLVGIGLGLHSNESQLQVKPADSTIDVSPAGIKVIGYGLSATSEGLAVKSADDSMRVGEDGIKVNPYYLARDGLSVKSDGLYVKSADNTINVSSGGIKVNVQSGGGILSGEQGLYFDSSIINIPSVHSYAGDGLYGSGGRLYVKSADDTIYVSSAGIKVNTLEPLVGLGLEWSGAQALYVKSADNTIDVSEAGIKVNPAALAHTLPGKGLYSDNGKISIHVDTAGLGITDSGSIYWKKPDPGWGLESGESGTYYVKSADNTIYVSHAGIKVNGYGLSAMDYGLSVEAVDGTIGVTSSGIGVNVTSGGGLLTGNDGLYIDSGQLAGNGLAYYSEQNNVKLYVKSADNTIDVSADGIKVNKSALSIPTASSLAGFGLNVDGSSLYVASADDTISVSSSGIKVNPSALSVPTASSLAGMGLQLVNDTTLYIKSADDTVNVSYEGIKLNASSTAGQGLIGYGSSIYVRSADNTIDVDYDGIKVNTGYGLETTSSGLYVKSADSFIDLSSSGVGLNVSNLYSHMDASSSNIEYNGSLNTIVAKSDTGGKITSLYSGSGIRINDSGSIDVPVDGSTIKISSEDVLYVDTSALSLSVPTASSLARDGLEARHNSLYVKSADDTINVSPEGIKVNLSALSIPTIDSLAGMGLQLGNGGESLYVKSADNTIYVESGGIRVNVDILPIPTASLLAEDGLEAKSDSLYVKSADDTINVSADGIKVNTGSVAAAILGQGLEYSSGKLNVYYGSGLAIDAESGKLYVTSVTPEVGKGLYVPSGSSRINVYAGSGIMFDTMNRVSVYAGSGLALVGPEGYGSLQVKAGSNNTISVYESGIEVNAGPGLCYAGSLYIQSADNSINVATDGITVNYGDGLFMNDASKLAVNVGYGLGIDENGGLARLISHSTDGTNWYKKYQDGWIEQGGYFSSNSQEATVTLNTAFANTNYTLMVTSRTGGSSPNYNPAISEKTTTSFKYNSMIAKAFGAEYYACGY